mgnify:CR=1 FL=1|nr:MAG TPA: hypothetical protein [Caudoviricetes sp.]
MKYFKILEISYSDNLNITYCKELSTEEIKKDDETTTTFTTYIKLGNVYSNEIFEEKTENLEKKTVREITKDVWQEEVKNKKEEVERKIQRELKELEEYKNFKTDLDKELARLEKPEA